MKTKNPIDIAMEYLKGSGVRMDDETIKKAKKYVNQKTKLTSKEQEEIKILQRKALSLWKKRVKERAGGKCEACGNTKHLQCHHIESYSTNQGLRYDEENGLLLDRTCHKFGRKSAHKSFCFVYNLMRIERCGSLNYLLEHYEDKVEITKEFLLETIERLSK